MRNLRKRPPFMAVNTGTEFVPCLFRPWTERLPGALYGGQGGVRSINILAWSNGALAGLAPGERHIF